MWIRRSEYERLIARANRAEGEARLLRSTQGASATPKVDEHIEMGGMNPLVQDDELLYLWASSVKFIGDSEHEIMITPHQDKGTCIYIVVQDGPIDPLEHFKRLAKARYQNKISAIDEI